MHNLKEPKNYLLASDGLLCRKFVMIKIHNLKNPSSHPICEANIVDAKIYFKVVWDMELNIGKGICHVISVKKTSVYKTISDRFKSKYNES